MLTDRFPIRFPNPYLFALFKCLKTVPENPALMIPLIFAMHELTPPTRCGGFSDQQVTDWLIGALTSASGGNTPLTNQVWLGFSSCC